MKAIIIDDNVEFAKQLKDSFGDKATILFRENDFYASSTPLQISKWIASQAKTSDDAVILMNIDVKCKGRSRQDQAGVDILKYLRLSERFNKSENEARDIHCVLFSFQTVEQLLRKKPGSVIICSKGTTLVRLPYDFGKLSLKDLFSRKAIADSLAPYIRGEFTLPDERHDWANWWAGRQMVSVYVHERQPQDIGLEDFMGKIEDVRIRNALYIYDHPEELRNAVVRIDKKRITTLRKRIWQNIGHQHHQQNEGEFDTWKLKIGLIDDEAARIGQVTNFGWQRIYSRMLFNNDTGVRDLLDEAGVKEYESPTQFEQLSFVDYGCLLLDLRLKGEKDRTIKIQELSGAGLLDEIRNGFPALPVIITTASNKVWSFETLMQLGADGYWIKQGLDERRTERETIENYIKLLELVANATDEKYQFMGRFWSQTAILQRQQNLWWEKHAWQTGERTEGRGYVIFQILNDAIQMLRTYLHQHLMGYGYRTETSERFWMGAIIQKLGNVIEEVHRFDELDESSRTSGTIGGYRRTDGTFQENRKDWFAWRLYWIRNKASHQPLNESDTINWENFKDFTSNLLCYLHYGPQESFRGTHNLEEMRWTCPNTYAEHYKKIKGGIS